MNLFHRRAICLYASVLLAVAFIAIRIPPSAKIVCLSAVLLFTVLVLLPRIRRRIPSAGRLASLAAVSLLALLLPLLAKDLPTASALSVRNEDGNLLEFRVTKRLNDFTYVADRVTNGGEPLPLVSLLVVSGDTLEVGDRVRATAELAQLTESDLRYYGQNGAHAVATLRELHFSEQRGFSLRAAMASASENLLCRVREAGGEAGDLFAALLLGETACLRDRTDLSFRRLGISHILAVSGMHLVTLSMALAALLRRLRLPRAAVISVTLPMMLLYTLLTGASPSVLRAFAMALVMQLSYFFERKNDTLTALFFSGAVLCVCNPFLLYSISFLLSFTATFGIVVCFQAVRASDFLGHLSPTVRNYLVTPALSTLAATVFTLPITLTVFGQLSLLALPANLLLGLPFQLLLCLAVPVLFLGPLPAVTVVSKWTALPLLSLVHRLSAIPMAAVDASHPLVLTAAWLLVLVLLLLLLLPRAPQRLFRVLSLGTGTLLLLSLFMTAVPRIDKGGTAVAAKGGVGDYVILSTGLGRAVLSCAGTVRGSEDVLFEALSREAVTELSLYIPAHYGAASLSELTAISRRCLVRRAALPLPAGAEETDCFRKMCAYLQGEGIPFKVIPSGGAASIGSFSVSLSARRALGNEMPVYTAVIQSTDKRIAYLSASGGSDLTAELLHALRADTLILGSLGLSEPTPVSLPLGASPRQIVFCSPLYTAEGELRTYICNDYFRIP